MTRKLVPILMILVAAGCTQKIEELGRQPSHNVTVSLSSEPFQTSDGPALPVWATGEKLQMYDGFERRRFIESKNPGNSVSNFVIPLNQQASSYFVVRARDVNVVKLEDRSFELITGENCGFSPLQSGIFQDAAIGAGLCENVGQTSFEVKNILGGLQFTVMSQDVVYAEISSFDGKQQMAGNISIDVSTGEPIAAYTKESPSYAILAGPLTKGECYATTIPADFPKGLKVKLLDANNNEVYTRWYDDPIQIKRSAFNDLGCVDVYRYMYFPIGDGSAENPYVISSHIEFKNLITVTNSEDLHEQYWDKHFLLTADIDCSRYGNIGSASSTYPFKGVLDGSSHKIINFTSNQTTGIPSGLFGSLTEEATVKNLILENANITSNGASVGGIAGYVDGGYVIGCSIDTASYISTSTGEAGGVVGTIKANSTVTIEKCAFYGKLSAQYYTGGIVGIVTSYAPVNINSCAVKGATVTASGYKEDTNNYIGLGGILGYGYPYTGGAIVIDGCLCRNTIIESTATSIANGSIGGILGHTYGTKNCCTVRNCYTKASVISAMETENKGEIFGLIRWGSSTNFTKIANCYYPQKTSIGNSQKGVLENNEEISVDEYTDGTLLGKLQSSSQTTVWVAGTDGYPTIQGINETGE